MFLPRLEANNITCSFSFLDDPLPIYLTEFWKWEQTSNCYRSVQLDSCDAMLPRHWLNHVWAACVTLFLITKVHVKIESRKTFADPTRNKSERLYYVRHKRRIDRCEVGSP